VASNAQDGIRRDALTAYLGTRVREGYVVETRTDTHAIIAQPDEASSFLGRFRQQAPRDRQVVAVDASGEVTTSPALPLRS
jgi:hypothetical protein